ncbi:MAG: purine-nucleoside phosphorylase [Bacteroidota bacterium]
MSETINKIVTFIKEKVNITPEIGIILGSGLGSFINEIEITHSLEYSAIPNFLVSTVEGHSGKLIFGKIANKNVVVMQGRFHYYEGYTLQQLALPIRVLKLLGINKLLLSNASGGLNPEYKIGDLMIFDDHINLMGGNPLLGPNNPSFGPRFPDMSAPYDKLMVNKAYKFARENGIKAHIGVFVGVHGPTFETRAEYRYLRIIGADAVAMSTVPEVIAARHLGLSCFAISVITDSGVPDEIVEISHEDVLRVANEAATKVSRIFKCLIADESI